ncbi:hypothetical protein B0J14DRAFT_603251 [Halenospora varia]|nr:hypothetical protein B0J14DRAFT_603251 [Halenospora varia]
MEETQHSSIRPSNVEEPHMAFHFFPVLPSEIRLKIWNYAVFLLEPQVVSVKMEPSQLGVLIPTGRTAVQCPLLRVNHEARTETLNAVRPYTHNNKYFPVVYINFELHIILFEDGKSFHQFWRSVEEPCLLEVDVPHIALFYVTWKGLYNPLLYLGDVDRVEDTDMDIDTFMNCMRCIWSLGVRGITIVVTGEDICQRSAVIFETPKESPLESSVSKNELFGDWKTMELEIEENIKSYQETGIANLTERILSNSTI